MKHRHICLLTILFPFCLQAQHFDVPAEFSSLLDHNVSTVRCYRSETDTNGRFRIPEHLYMSLAINDNRKNVSLYEFNEQGKITGEYRYTFNKAGHIIKETVSDQAGEETLDYFYDNEGRLVREEDRYKDQRWKKNGTETDITSYHYNDSGQLVSKVFTTGNRMETDSFFYSEGLLARMIHLIPAADSNKGIYLIEPSEITYHYKDKKLWHTYTTYHFTDDISRDTLYYDDKGRLQKRTKNTYIAAGSYSRTTWLYNEAGDEVYMGIIMKSFAPVEIRKQYNDKGLLEKETRPDYAFGRYSLYRYEYITSKKRRR